MADAAAATRQARIANANASCSPVRNGPEISSREEAAPGHDRVAVRRQRGKHVRPGQVLDRVVAEERGEQHRDRRRVPDTCAALAGSTPWACSPADSVCGQRTREPGDHQREEDPDRQNLSGVLEGLVHAAARAAIARRQAVHHGGPVGRGEQAHRDSVHEQDRPRTPGRRSRSAAAPAARSSSAAPIIPPVANRRAPKRSDR